VTNQGDEYFDHSGFAQEAPFGFHWGDRSLPKPSEMLQEKNITAFLYRRDTIPEQIRDAEEIILKVCDKEGVGGEFVV
jgi:hypothetical protein